MDGIGGRAPRLDHAGGRALLLGHSWEVAAWVIAHLGSCHMGKYPWEVATWEKKMPLAKYLTSFFTTKAKNCFIALKCTCLLSRTLNKVLAT